MSQPANPRPCANDPLVVGIGGRLGGSQDFFRKDARDRRARVRRHRASFTGAREPSCRSATTPREDARILIPPARNLSAIDTHLRISALEELRKERAPIDHFFRTLAATFDGNSIALILTGTGSDGTLGLKAVRERGGLTIVQEPNEAEYDGMPRSAVATGLVDLVLPLARIPEAILRFVTTAPQIAVPTDGEEVRESAPAPLNTVYALLRARTGRDFSGYKRSTILRRMQRRMQLQHLEDLSEYVALLHGQPEEVRALGDDMLVTVTSFFRDPDVFTALEKDIVPRLLQERTIEEPFRAWSIGCATGEEAYSIAMLLLEQAMQHEPPP